MHNIGSASGSALPIIHAQEGTRGLLQNLLKQEECSSSAGDGLDETRANDKVVTEKDASRDTRKRCFFTRSALPNCKAGTCLFCLEAWLQETK